MAMDNYTNNRVHAPFIFNLVGQAWYWALLEPVISHNEWLVETFLTWFDAENAIGTIKQTTGESVCDLTTHFVQATAGAGQTAGRQLCWRFADSTWRQASGLGFLWQSRITQFKCHFHDRPEAGHPQQVAYLPVSDVDHPWQQEVSKHRLRPMQDPKKGLGKTLPSFLTGQIWSVIIARNKVILKKTFPDG